MRRLLLALVLACSTGAKDALPPLAPTQSARTSGPAGVDSSRVGSSAAPQSFTPAMTARPHTSALQPMWTVDVGATTAATTLVAFGGSLYVGTATGVTVLSATKGTLVRRVALGAVVGIALDRGQLFATVGDGSLVSLSQDGTTRFRTALAAAPTSAPALADLNADGAVDALASDIRGNVTAIDGKSGTRLWSTAIGPGEAGAASLVDLDGDGHDDVVVGSASGALVGLRGRDGAVLFRTPGDGPLRAPPVVVDLDGDGREELVVTWTRGTVAIVDRAGNSLWKTRVEEDDGTAAGLVASAIPIMSEHNALFAVPTAGRGALDGMVLVGERLRAFRSHEGTITSTPVVARVETEELPSALVGTDAGAIVAFDALGHRTALANVGGAISASLLVSDVDAQGLLEIFAVTTAGKLTALQSPAPAPAVIPRFRGASPHNDGRIPPVRLPWRLGRGDAQ